MTVHHDECVYVQEGNEVSHDETDIDMLTRAKKSCEKYLISTLRQLLCVCVCRCVCDRLELLSEDLKDKSLSG